MSVVGPRYLPITIELGEDARNARSVYQEFNVSNTQLLHPRTEAKTTPNRVSIWSWWTVEHMGYKLACKMYIIFASCISRSCYDRSSVEKGGREGGREGGKEGRKKGRRACKEKRWFAKTRCLSLYNWYGYLVKHVFFFTAYWHQSWAQCTWRGGLGTWHT